MPAKPIKYGPDTDIKIYEARRNAYINYGYAPVDTNTEIGKACILSKKDINSPKIYMSFIEGRII